MACTVCGRCVSLIIPYRCKTFENISNAIIPVLPPRPVMCESWSRPELTPHCQVKAYLSSCSSTLMGITVNHDTHTQSQV